MLNPISGAVRRRADPLVVTSVLLLAVALPIAAYRAAQTSPLPH